MPILFPFHAEKGLRAVCGEECRSAKRRIVPRELVERLLSNRYIRRLALGEKKGLLVAVKSDYIRPPCFPTVGHGALYRKQTDGKPGID